jgi:DNA helicase-2/ATP-dependent DNA helicase PcrA
MLPRRAAPAGPAQERRRRRSEPAACRVCGRSLAGAVARKLGRCEDCPSAYDEALFERLREWRGEQARTASVPAYVVFTDATLTAIAEARPRTVTELLAISGVGPSKLERYGDAVLAICGLTHDPSDQQ